MEKLPALNVFGAPIEPCSPDPLTGFFRDGCCNTCAEDTGEHTICVEMTEGLLLFSRDRGNDLLTPQLNMGFPGLLPDDRWCLCLPRWIEAWEAGITAPINLRATHQSVLDTVPLEVLERYTIDDA